MKRPSPPPYKTNSRVSWMPKNSRPRVLPGKPEPSRPSSPLLVLQSESSASGLRSICLSIAIHLHSRAGDTSANGSKRLLEFKLQLVAGCVEFVRMIRAAHHRPAGDVNKTHFRAMFLECGKCLRRNKFNHGEMPQRRLQILAQR